MSSLLSSCPCQVWDLGDSLQAGQVLWLQGWQSGWSLTVTYRRCGFRHGVSHSAPAEARRCGTREAARPVPRTCRCSALLLHSLSPPPCVPYHALQTARQGTPQRHSPTMSPSHSTQYGLCYQGPLSMPPQPQSCAGTSLPRAGERGLMRVTWWPTPACC